MVGGLPILVSSVDDDLFCKTDDRSITRVMIILEFFVGRIWFRVLEGVG